MPRIRGKAPAKKPVATSILRPFTFCPCRQASRQNGISPERSEPRKRLLKGCASKSGRFRLFRRRFACRRNTPTARLSGFALGYPLATLGPHFVRRLPRAWLLHTRRLDPTFRFGAFFFVASALADVPSTRLALDLPRHHQRVLDSGVVFSL